MNVYGKTRQEIEDMLFKICEISDVGNQINVPFDIALWFYSEKISRKTEEKIR